MFKSFYSRNATPGDRPWKHGRAGAFRRAFSCRRERVALLLATLFAMGAGAGCRHLSPLEPANLTEPGWTIRRGQAVWRPKPGEAEIVGNLLVASNVAGPEFVRFSKDPLELVVARRSPEGWQVEIPSFGKFYSGRGRPPRRVLWFQLADAVSGDLESGVWSWSTPTEGRWCLESRVTGERLEGFFRP